MEKEMMTPTSRDRQLVYDDGPVKVMIYPALFFMMIGMAIGVFMAFNTFVIPNYFSGEHINFGRIRPMHVSHVLLLWLLSANVGLFYFMIPRLCGVSLWSPPLAYLSASLWWVALILGIYSFPWGTNVGWEYAELPMWVGFVPIKYLLILSWVMLAVNLFMTVAKRRYEKMYVSLWYAMGTLLWASFTFNLGFHAINYIPEGMTRMNANFFYVHNLVGMIFTPMGVAIAYYFLPKLSGLPIYSHRLSMVGFWSVAFVYAWVGAHHMIHGPASQWLQTTAIIFSIWLFIPVWTVVANLFYTMKGHWDLYVKNPAIRFLIMGNLFYLMTCIQGPLMALRNVNEITSKTDWVIGHSHISLYATFSFFAFAGVYYVIPVITRRPIWSNALSEWHFQMNIWGSIPFLAALWIGGFLQGMQWATWAEGSTYAQFHLKLAQLPFLQTVVDMRPWWLLRGLGGLVILFGNILFAVNMFNTIILQPTPAREVA